MVKRNRHTLSYKHSNFVHSHNFNHMRTYTGDENRKNILCSTTNVYCVLPKNYFVIENITKEKKCFMYCLVLTE